MMTGNNPRNPMRNSYIPYDNRPKVSYWVTTNRQNMPLKVTMSKHSDVDDLTGLLHKLRLFGETVEIGKKNYSVVDYSGMCIHRNVKLSTLSNSGNYECPFLITF